MDPDQQVAYTAIDPSLLPPKPVLSDQERRTVGLRMQLPQSEWPKINKYIALSMPEHPACVAYMNWASRPTPITDTQPLGILIENREVWIRRNGQDKFDELLASIRATGQPTLHWFFVHGVSED